MLALHALLASLAMLGRALEANTEVLEAKAEELKRAMVEATSQVDKAQQPHVKQTRALSTVVSGGPYLRTRFFMQDGFQYDQPNKP